VIWAYAYGGPEDELAHQVVQTSDGGYAVIGATASLGLGQALCRSAWLLKLNADGTLAWSKVMVDIMLQIVVIW